jgi:hypothetical protein
LKLVSVTSVLGQGEYGLNVGVVLKVQAVYSSRLLRVVSRRMSKVFGDSIILLKLLLSIPTSKYLSRELKICK